MSSLDSIFNRPLTPQQAHVNSLIIQHPNMTMTYIHQDHESLNLVLCMVSCHINYHEVHDLSPVDEGKLSLPWPV